MGKKLQKHSLSGVLALEDGHSSEAAKPLLHWPSTYPGKK